MYESTSLWCCSRQFNEQVIGGRLLGAMLRFFKGPLPGQWPLLHKQPPIGLLAIFRFLYGQHPWANGKHQTMIVDQTLTDIVVPRQYRQVIEVKLPRYRHLTKPSVQNQSRPSASRRLIGLLLPCTILHSFSSIYWAFYTPFTLFLANAKLVCFPAITPTHSISSINTPSVSILCHVSANSTASSWS